MTHEAETVGAAGPTLDAAVELAGRLHRALASVVLGHDAALRLVVAGVLAGGHVLLEDAPGVGKTTLAKALARSLGGTVGRVQGTTDLLPSDVVGVTIFNQSTATWTFRPGPVFHNVVVVDEVNRATPRAQSALLEAMAEGAVTVDGTTHALPSPFVVVATQNPFGDVGTHPLVAGQLDRFTIGVSLALPGRDAERALLAGVGGAGALDDLVAVTSPAELLDAIAAIGRVPAAPPVVEYLLDLAAAVRDRSGTPTAPSPRAVLTLLGVARAHAVVHGRRYVAPDDVKAVAVPVLGHRLADPGAVTAALDATRVPVG